MLSTISGFGRQRPAAQDLSCVRPNGMHGHGTPRAPCWALPLNRNYCPHLQLPLATDALGLRRTPTMELHCIRVSAALVTVRWLDVAAVFWRHCVVIRWHSVLEGPAARTLLPIDVATMPAGARRARCTLRIDRRVAIAAFDSSSYVCHRAGL
jgi:hypothetical protein